MCAIEFKTINTIKLLLDLWESVQSIDFAFFKLKEQVCLCLNVSWLYSTLPNLLYSCSESWRLCSSFGEMMSLEDAWKTANGGLFIEAIRASCWAHLWHNLAVISGITSVRKQSRNLERDSAIDWNLHMRFMLDAALHIFSFVLKYGVNEMSPQLFQIHSSIHSIGNDVLTVNIMGLLITVLKINKG